MKTRQGVRKRRFLCMKRVEDSGLDDNGVLKIVSYVSGRVCRSERY